MSQKQLSTVPKQSRPNTVATRPRQPSPTRPSTLDRKTTSSQETLQHLKPAHKLGHIPEYLRKGRGKACAEVSENSAIWEEKCRKLEEDIVRHKQTSEAQQQLIESLRERVAQLDAVVLEIKPELTRLCAEIEVREHRIKSLERSLADKSATKLDNLCEEVHGLKQLVQQPAHVFQYYGHQLNSTMDMLAGSYYQLLTMVENRRTKGYTVDSGPEEEPDRNLDRQKMRLDKRNKYTQIRVKKYDG